MSSPRSLRSAIAALAPVLVLSVGCSDTTEASTLDGAEVLVAKGAFEGESDVMVSGVVEKIGNCVGIRVEQTLYPMVWPGAAKVESSSVSVDGMSFGMGDQLSAGGAFFAEPHPIQVPDIPESCRSETGEVVVLSELR